MLLAPSLTKSVLSRKNNVRSALLKAYIARLHTDGELDAVIHPDAEGRHRRAARKFVRQLFKPIVNIERDRLSTNTERDNAVATTPMGRMVRWMHENGKGFNADYETEGIPPSQTFRCLLRVDDQEAEGLGGSKKDARRA